MKKTKPIINCLVLAAFFLSASGCEWDQPLSPSKDATVDPKLLGNWKARYETDFLKHIEVKPDKETLGTYLMVFGAIKDVAYAPEAIPAGAMFLDAVTQHQFGDHSGNMLCWPTRFKMVSYLNYVDYDFAKKKPGKRYTIVKYEATEKTLHFYMPKKKHHPLPHKYLYHLMNITI